MADPRSSIDIDAIPSPRRDADVGALPLSAREGYVLSRMDGVMNVGELLAACGVPQAEGEGILQKLVGLGAVDILKLMPEERPASGVGASKATRGDKSGGRGADVTPALQERITEMLRLSEESNFYEFLGVTPDSDRAVIRSAYFTLSQEFHPDSYYGKDLGPWRAKMELVFGRLTDAYETLSRPKKRDRYDQYISEQIRAWEMEQRLAQVPALVLYRPKAQPVEEEAPAEEPPRPSAPVAATPVAAPAMPAPAPRPVAVLGPETDLHRRLREEKKKKALQALLKATGKSRAATAAREEKAPAKPFVPASAEQQLALQYAVAGADALDRKEFMAALNFFELALQITPDDPKVRDAIERVREEAGASLSKTYEKQGAYEEELGQYVRAAQSFLKALDVRKNDHQLMERTARNLLKGGGNLKRAEELVRNAIKLEPNTVDYRATLGEILLKKGAATEAGRELEEARRLDPSNARVQELLGRRGR